MSKEEDDRIGTGGGEEPAAVPTPENIEEEEHWMFTLGTDHESPDAPVKEEE